MSDLSKNPVPRASAEFDAVAFPELNDAQIAALDAVGQRRRFTDGEFLFHTGRTT